ncbi:hypothetical protein KC19_10G088400 [Ceratodon purpureus]|uniref:Protein kinase domain-containing protein n=1 Tax=Ceratodon purpureus TaxID=3225 RepID=A0A8T0GIF7_CERPU|nr:hypothetical protein KC19_10G088400 [Ceratodon purpureus]
MASSSHETRVCSDDQTIQEPWSLFSFLIGLFRSPSSSASWYHSARIQRMIEKSGEFRTEVESESEAAVQYEIESSKVHWSEVNPALSETPHMGYSNRGWFKLLKRRQYYVYGKDQIVFKQYDEEQVWNLFRDSLGHDLVVGKKLAEGGQAEIYEANIGDGDSCVVKVFKAGCILHEILEKQIPPALLHSSYVRELGWISHATLLKDERFLDRFAFVMGKAWGDLRKLIDEQMIQSGNQCPPFPPNQVWGLMREIARGMSALHCQNPPILHNDLKAANVLVQLNHDTGKPAMDKRGMYLVYVADFECSVGVLGTAFWRAPEILQQYREKVSKVVFTKKCDVYSFGMTCYELISGCLPFEDHPSNDYDMVLNGSRPELPSDLNPLFKDIITSCWSADPLERPTFDDIIDKLYENANSYF